MAKKRLLCILILSLTFSVSAEQSIKKEKKEFYYDRERGWYSYEKEAVKEDKKEEPKESKQFQKPVVDWDAVWTMHPKEFSKLFDDLRAYALMYPTEENVVEYYKMNSIYLDRAKMFQEASTMVAQTHPELSRENKFPASAVGQTEYRNQRKEEIDRTLKQNADRYALIYFYSPTCGYCEKQSPILQYFVEDTGWSIKSVDITKEQNAALRFNIESTPSLVMIKKNSKDWVRISSGILPLADIKERVAKSLGGQLRTSN